MPSETAAAETWSEAAAAAIVPARAVVTKYSSWRSVTDVGTSKS
jgi:hypothetical protein